MFNEYYKADIRRGIKFVQITNLTKALLENLIQSTSGRTMKLLFES